MADRRYRRSVIAAVPALLGGLAGCSVLADESRVIGLFVVNQTDEHRTVEIELRHDGDVLAEQRVELPDERPDADGTHASVLTQVSVADIADGSTVTGEIVVDDDRTETVEFTADCPVDDELTGDELSVHVRDDGIDVQTGRCTDAGLPSNPV